MPRTDLIRLAVACGAVVAVTVIYSEWLLVSNAATVSTTLLLIVLLVATTSRLWVAVVTAILSVLSFNFFFLPPVGTFTIADPENWIALFAFLAVSLVASNLSAVARARTQEALSRRDELARLFDLSRDVLVITDGREARTTLTRAIARRFDLAFVAIALPQSGELGCVHRRRGRHRSGSRRAVVGVGRRAASRSNSTPRRGPTRAIEPSTVGRTSGSAGAAARRHQTDRPAAAAGRPIEPGTLDALAGVVAIAIEHARFLDERKAAELTRRSEELKAGAPGVTRARSADAADGDPRRSEQPEGGLAETRSAPSKAT